MKINLTIATDIEGQGGIASLLNVYRDSMFFKDNNVRLISTHSTNNRLGFVGLFFIYLLAVFKLIFYFVFYKVGLVHVHMASEGSYLRKALLVRLIKRIGGKVILHLHGAEFRGFYANKCKDYYKKHIRDTFEMSDCVIVLSTHWLDWAKLTFNKYEHFKIIYNAVPKLNLKRDQLELGLITFLGRINQRKGVEDLIRALPIVHLECPHARLVLGGDGSTKVYQALTAKLGITDSVEFLGWVSEPKKSNLLAMADVYCLPSYNEGFPMGVLEAMSANIAVVSTYAGGIPDAITSEKEGILVEAGHIETLAKALIKLIKDRKCNHVYANSACEKFNRCFSIAAVLPQVQEVYDQLNQSPQDL